MKYYYIINIVEHVTKFIHRGISKLTEEAVKKWRRLVREFDYYINAQLILKITFRRIYHPLKEVYNPLLINLSDLVYKHLTLDSDTFNSDTESDKPPMTLVISKNSISLRYA